MFKELEAAIMELRAKQDAVANAEKALETARLALGSAKNTIQNLHNDYMKIVGSVVSNGAKSVSH